LSTPVNGAIGRTGAARNSAVGGTRNSQTNKKLSEAVQGSGNNVQGADVAQAKCRQ